MQEHNNFRKLKKVLLLVFISTSYLFYTQKKHTDTVDTSNDSLLIPLELNMYTAKRGPIYKGCEMEINDKVALSRCFQRGIQSGIIYNLHP